MDHLPEADVLFALFTSLEFTPQVFQAWANFFMTDAFRIMKECKINNVQFDWEKVKMAQYLTRSTEDVNYTFNAIAQQCDRLHAPVTMHNVTVNGVQYSAPSGDDMSAVMLFNLVALATGKEQADLLYQDLKECSSIAGILFDPEFINKLTQSDLPLAAHILGVAEILMTIMSDKFFCYAGALLVFSDQLPTFGDLFEAEDFTKEVIDLATQEIRNSNITEYDLNSVEPTNDFVGVYDMYTPHNDVVSNANVKADFETVAIECLNEQLDSVGDRGESNKALYKINQTWHTMAKASDPDSVRIMASSRDYHHDIAYNKIEDYVAKRYALSKVKKKTAVYVMGNNRNTRFQDLTLNTEASVVIMRPDQITFERIPDRKNYTIFTNPNAYAANLLAAEPGKVVVLDMITEDYVDGKWGGHTVEYVDVKGFDEAIRDLDFIIKKDHSTPTNQYHSQLPSYMVIRAAPYFTNKGSSSVVSFFSRMTHHYDVKVYPPNNFLSNVFTFVFVWRKKMAPKKHNKQLMFDKLLSRHILNVLYVRYAILRGMRIGRYSIKAFHPLRSLIREYGMMGSGKKYNVRNIANFANWRNGNIFADYSNVLTATELHRLSLQQGAYFGLDFKAKQRDEKKTKGLSSLARGARDFHKAMANPFEAGGRPAVTEPMQARYAGPPAGANNNSQALPAEDSF